MEGTTTQSTSFQDSPLRSPSFLNPESAIQSFGLQTGNLVADFGCGAGFFVLPVARAIGSTGRVYAIDIQKEMLAALRAKAQMAKLLNIDYIWADLERPLGSHLKDSFVDFVIIANILFQAPDKKQIFQEAARILKPAAKMAVIEWDESVSGPPAKMKILKQTVRELASSVGLRDLKEFDVGSHHYGMLFGKSG